MTKTRSAVLLWAILGSAACAGSTTGAGDESGTTTDFATPAPATGDAGASTGSAAPAVTGVPVSHTSAGGLTTPLNGATSAAGAVGAWTTGAEFATGTAEIATAVPIGALAVLGTALKPLGLKFVTDAVSNVLCVVPQIVRCSTFADYVGCVQRNQSQPEECAEAAAACGFGPSDQAALAGAAVCATELSQCPGALTTCAAASSSCDQFGASELTSAVSGIASKATADVLSALVPLLNRRESDHGGCQCALQFGQCVVDGLIDTDACAQRASVCASNGPPVSPPVTQPPPVSLQ